MNLISILLMAPQAGEKGSGYQSFIMIGLLIVVFYFFMIRPQMKRSKEQRKFIETMEKGQHVITNGGIHGKIVEMQESTVIIETEGGGRLKIEKSSIVIDPRANAANKN